MDRKRWRRLCYDLLYSVQTEKTKYSNTLKIERDSSDCTIPKESKEEHNRAEEESNLNEEMNN